MYVQSMLFMNLTFAHEIEEKRLIFLFRHNDFDVLHI